MKRRPHFVLTPSDVLLVTDVQRDFLPGGALAVRGGEAVVAPLNRCIERFSAAGARIIATRDWHPPGHCSFAAQGGPWPEHCVAGSSGAALDPALALPPGVERVDKGSDREREAYSAFSGTDLEPRLRRLGARRLFIGGLTTDYCVLQTTLDARRLGFAVVVLRDAVAAVDAVAGDGERALRQMREAGAVLADSSLVAG